MTMLEGRLSRHLQRVSLRAVLCEIVQQHKMLGEGNAHLRSRLTHHFFSRNRRLFVKRFRNERRRTERFWKHTEGAGYLLERLLLVGPVQGGVVEAVHDGGFDDFEIGRDVEV